MSIITTLRETLRRNSALIAVISAALFATMIVTGIVVYLILWESSTLVGGLQSWAQSTASYIAIPPPYTNGLYQFIFLNNIGHFWNPIRLWVWIPFVGAFQLGYELLLNAVLIGAVASFVSITKGPMYTIAGLVPHGVIEIPAFILEFTGLARWHVSTTRALYTKLSGQPVDGPLLRRGIVDTVTLSLLSVALFAVAAYVETFITPHFLGR
ncbi:MAG TPA: stage II sporulation protein M [archaeon]|nr:stage II sporulation protein M [archaeon]